MQKVRKIKKKVLQAFSNELKPRRMSAAGNAIRPAVEPFLLEELFRCKKNRDFQVNLHWLADNVDDLARHFFMIARTKEEVFMDIRGSRFTFEGNSTFVLTFNDKTNHFKYEDAQDENRNLQMLNAYVSHELRNPLNSIQSQNIQTRELCA